MIDGSGETRQQGAQTSRFVQMFQALTGSTGISIGPGMQDSVVSQFEILGLAA
jgi:hypothetical protein